MRTVEDNEFELIKGIKVGHPKIYRKIINQLTTTCKN